MPLGPALSKINPIHLLTLYLFHLYLFKVDVNVILQFPSRSSKMSLSFTFFDYSFVCKLLLIFPVRSTCDTHHTILDFIILIIFVKNTQITILIIVFQNPLCAFSLLGTTIVMRTVLKHAKL
jgi:hypothetical protein